MKKILPLGLILTASIAWAANNKLSKIGPSLATLVSWANSATESRQGVSIAAPTATGARNCLSNLTTVATATSTVRVLDGGTTVYQVDLAAASPLNQNWADGDMCATANTAMHVNISTAVRAGTTFGIQTVNISGYTY